MAVQALTGIVDAAITGLERSRAAQLCAILLVSVAAASVVAARIDSSPPPPASAFQVA